MRELADAAEAALLDPRHARIVDMVGRRVGDDTYRLAANDGSITFRRTRHRGRDVFDILAVSGVDPVANQAADHLGSQASEVAAPHPDRAHNSFPQAFERSASVFDHPDAPDLVVLHHPGHHNHGTLGEHGGLSVGQSRAPFIMSGRGVKPLGVVDDQLSMVDVAPTVVRLLTGGDLLRADGAAADRLLTGEQADHVVLFLLDGLNNAALSAALDEGFAPNIAALLTDRGGVRPANGVLASLPSVTLANHFTATTGLHPGRSGVLHNEWLSADGPVDLLDVAQMLRASDHLLPGVETVYEAIHRLRPGSFTASTFEYSDRGADWTTYSVMRAGGLLDVPLNHERFMSSVDAASTRQAISLWNGSTGTPPPDFLWVNFTLTDDAGHEAGPHSDLVREAITDSDRRIGAVLRTIERAGRAASTAVIVMADHGMQLTDPARTGSVSEILHEAGVDHVDIGDGLVYLGR